MRSKEAAHSIEEVGSKLRAAMPFWIRSQSPWQAGRGASSSRASRRLKELRIDRNCQFQGSHCSHPLYQGPTLVGPLRPNKDLSFSPCAFFRQVRDAG